jgi:ferric-dicitrate binding protein FerR (iron transport regulator)
VSGDGLRPDERSIDEAEAPPLDPREEARIEELLSELPVEAPAPAFRSELRAAFVSGRLATGAEEPARVEVTPVRRRFPPALWQLPLAAAAALVLWALFGRGDGQGWRAGSGGELLARALSTGSAFESGEESADAITEDGLHVRLLPGTRLAAARGDELALDVERGEALIWLPPDYEGDLLSVTTPDARLQVTGTALSVMVNDELTCVCVEHGTVRLESGEAIEAHSSWRAQRDGGTAMCKAWLPAGTPGAEADAAHQAPLLAFVDERAGG